MYLTSGLGVEASKSTIGSIQSEESQDSTPYAARRAPETRLNQKTHKTIPME